PEKGLVRRRPTERGLLFRHVLIRDAAYGTLPKAVRAELHERLALWLEAQPAPSDELVGFHFEAAHGYLQELQGPGDRVDRLPAAPASRLPHTRPPSP